MLHVYGRSIVRRVLADRRVDLPLGGERGMLGRIGGTENSVVVAICADVRLRKEGAFC